MTEIDIGTLIIDTATTISATPPPFGVRVREQAQRRRSSRRRAAVWGLLLLLLLVLPWCLVALAWVPDRSCTRGASRRNGGVVHRHRHAARRLRAWGLPVQSRNDESLRDRTRQLFRCVATGSGGGTSALCGRPGRPPRPVSCVRLPLPRHRRRNPAEAPEPTPQSGFSGPVDRGLSPRGQRRVPGQCPAWGGGRLQAAGGQPRRGNSAPLSEAWLARGGDAWLAVGRRARRRRRPVLCRRRVEGGAPAAATPARCTRRCRGVRTRGASRRRRLLRRHRRPRRYVPPRVRACTRRRTRRTARNTEGGQGGRAGQGRACTRRRRRGSVWRDAQQRPASMPGRVQRGLGSGAPSGLRGHRPAPTRHPRKPPGSLGLRVRARARGGGCTPSGITAEPPLGACGPAPSTKRTHRTPAGGGAAQRKLEAWRRTRHDGGRPRASPARCGRPPLLGGSHASQRPPSPS